MRQEIRQEPRKQGKSIVRGRDIQVGDMLYSNKEKIVSIDKTLARQGLHLLITDKGNEFGVVLDKEYRIERGQLALDG